MKYLTIVLIGLLLMNACVKEEEVAVVSTRYGDMVLEFYPDVAPKHVESFKIHAKNGYFEGTTFHRVIPGFVIQGGDPNSRDNDSVNDGQGGHAAKYYGLGDEAVDTSWTLPAEFNDRPHVTGALSMGYKPGEPNSAGSQSVDGSNRSASSSSWPVSTSTLTVSALLSPWAAPGQ